MCGNPGSYSEEVTNRVHTLCVLPSAFTSLVFTQLEIGTQRPFKKTDEEQ